MIYELLIAMQQNSASNNVTVSLTNMIFSLHDVLHPFPVSFAFIKRLSIIKMIYIIKWYIYIYMAKLNQKFSQRNYGKVNQL